MEAHTHEQDTGGEEPAQWFDRATLTPLPPSMEPELLPDGTLGDRLWRARGWSTED